MITGGGDEGTVILLILDMPEQVELHICCIMLPELTVSHSDREGPGVQQISVQPGSAVMFTMLDTRDTLDTTTIFLPPSSSLISQKYFTEMFQMIQGQFVVV